MAPSQAIADARYLTVQTVERNVVAAVQELWRDATPDRILSAMLGETGRAILNAVMAGQLSVAQGAQAFVNACMMAQGVGFSPAAAVVPGALAGAAPDGGPLAQLLMVPAATTAWNMARGMPADLAAARGLNQMAMLVATTIADTSRTATQVAMTAEPRCVSYVRVVKLPACSRCIILAGRQYSYSEGFQRHPRCDCGMEPMSDQEWRSLETPEAMFSRMSPEQQDAKFGKASADAIRNGADVAQVVNARRGMSTATVHGRSVKTTAEGTTKRGIGGRALDAGFSRQNGQRVSRSNAPRLMPEEILRQSDDREHQIRLLRKHGYIT